MQESANVKWSREKKGETPRNSWLLKFAFILDKKKSPLRSRMKRESEQEQEVSKQERKKGEGRRKA